MVHGGLSARTACPPAPDLVSLESPIHRADSVLSPLPAASSSASTNPSPAPRRESVPLSLPDCTGAHGVTLQAPALPAGAFGEGPSAGRPRSANRGGGGDGQGEGTSSTALRPSSAQQEHEQGRPLSARSQARQQAGGSKQDGWHRIFAEHHEKSHGKAVCPRAVLKQFIREEAGGAMRAWFRYLDRNHNCKCDYNEFRSGILALKYPADVELLWEAMDWNLTSEILLEDLCPKASREWHEFQTWCAGNFLGPQEMIMAIVKAARSGDGAAPPVKQKESNGPLKRASTMGGDRMWASKENFILGLRRCGWPHGKEEMYVDALDIDEEGYVFSKHLKWLESAVARLRAKESSRKMTMSRFAAQTQARMICMKSLEEFKLFLRKRFGCIYQGWRQAFDPDGSMTVPKAEFTKVCRDLKFEGNVRSVWKALDKDGSGVSSIEELDPKCAQSLAKFKQWAEVTYGNKPLHVLWRILDPRGNDKVPHSEFLNVCKAQGFEWNALSLSHLLDIRRQKHLCEEDLLFLNVWRHPTWLLAEPDFRALGELKEAIIAKYGTSIKAWKHQFDPDHSNMCSWNEFVMASKHIQFHGNVAGAWLALDSDLSGSITFNEFDPDSFGALMQFKMWADQEFGSVRAAFKAIDKNHSGELDWREFRAATRLNGFDGDSWALFKNLDQGPEKNRRLQYKELAFLDDWECPDAAGVIFGEKSMCDADFCAQDSQTVSGSRVLESRMETPGPGAYELLSGFCALPQMPTARHGGAFSMASRSKQPVFLGSLVPVGPTDFTPKTNAVRKRTPAWSFGSSRRHVSERCQSSAEKRRAGRAGVVGGGVKDARSQLSDKLVPSPGPGSYEARSIFSVQKLCALGGSRGSAKRY
eukprot:TRINITY_DN16560_c0_g3_i1.p1 TRINITY_DN16560_c0_g3~~TRINITY_DN16560_c0_g3_i1.p1  ORF type:complete len:935 (-),score=163.35 TRINITY_DN16560_c0_g3_i1:12-2621(-)